MQLTESVMADQQTSAEIATTAKIGQHPLHPMLVPFPIAFLVATFSCDLAFWINGMPFMAQMAFWALGAALVGAVFAAIAGLIDFLNNDRIRAITDAWKHMIANVVAVVIAIISFFMRYRDGVDQAAGTWGVIASGVIVLLLLYSGWKGGELVYRHRIGVLPSAPIDKSGKY